MILLTLAIIIVYFGSVVTGDVDLDPTSIELIETVSQVQVPSIEIEPTPRQLRLSRAFIVVLWAFMRTLNGVTGYSLPFDILCDLFLTILFIETFI
jgi:hypothetical protein